MNIPRRLLCVITDQHTNPVELARMALEGGAGMVQLRRKSTSGRDLFEWTLRIQALCREHGALFIVNDRVDIALASHADGVHLGQQDMPVTSARKLLGTETLIGVSVSNTAEAAKAAKDGADYLGAGHIFPTGSKEKPMPPIGTAAIRPIIEASKLPVIAIGGIEVCNAAEVIAAGASGVAVISAVSGSEDPVVATRELVKHIRQ
ncbi:MAG TPA: thiamine phosphate synthase [Chlorobaculum parvum]|uniref:Thiamine-phosphate synthase n=1 Tax=Chlorobaculum parvum TaxID=274539 RepID=A0A7C5DCY9_9CHLB|nr:thiamine phosphate synthase [Chlorobaculum parvum]